MFGWFFSLESSTTLLLPWNLEDLLWAESPGGSGVYRIPVTDFSRGGCVAGAGAPLSRRKIAGGKKKEGHPVISLGWVLTVLAFWV